MKYLFISILLLLLLSCSESNPVNSIEKHRIKEESFYEYSNSGSIIMENHGYYKYDNSGRLIEIIYDNNGFYYHNREEYFYENSSKYPKIHIKYNNSSSGILSKEEFEYSDNKVVKKTKYNIDIDGEFKLYSKTSFYYQGNLMIRRYVENSYYDSTSETRWSYNGQKLVLKEYFYKGEPTSRSQYFYNSDNLMISHESQHLTDSNEWFSGCKIKYSYDKNEQLIESMYWQWSYENNAWKVNPYNMDTYTYTNGRITEKNNYSWDYFNDSLKMWSIISWKLDDYNNLTEYIINYVDNEDGSPTDIKIEYYYENEHSNLRVIGEVRHPESYYSKEYDLIKLPTIYDCE